MLSIVIPVYENPDTLAVVLRGISDLQEKLGLEIIVVNDGGEQEPIAEVVSWFSTAMRVKLLTLDPPTTEFRAGMARNMGALNSCGSRILFLDSDCVPRKHTLARHASYANEPVLIAGAIDIVKYNEELSMMTPTTSYTDASRALDRRYRLYQGVAKQLESTKCFRTDDYRPFWSGHMSVPAREFKSLGGFWEAVEGYGSEDQELAWRMKQSGCALAIDFVCSVDHIRPQSLQQPASRRDQIIAKSSQEPSLIRRGRFLPNLATAPV